MSVPAKEVIHEIRRWDVLMGRGKLVHQHVGNLEYRRIVKASCNAYKDRLEHRNEIAQEIMQTIESLGGRFIRSISEQDGKEVWVRCEPSVVRTKVKQALRDMTKQEVSVAPCSRKPGDQLKALIKESHQEAMPNSAQPKEQHDIQPSANDSRASGKKAPWAEKSKFSFDPVRGGPINTVPLDSIEMQMRSRAMNRLPVSSFIDSRRRSAYGSNQLDSNELQCRHYEQLSGGRVAETMPPCLLPSHYQTVPLISNSMAPFPPAPLAIDPVATTSMQELMKRYMEQERNPFPGIPSGLTSTEIAELMMELRRQQQY